jgi:outer membrane protein TolC
MMQRLRNWLRQRLRRPWLHGCVGVLLAFVLALAATGCRQQVFLDQECFKQSHEILPTQVEKDYTYGGDALQPFTKAPPTLLDPNRPAWNMTLHEAMAIALENGSIGDAAGAGAGALNETQAAFAGSVAGAIVQADRLKILAMNPAISGANLEATMARFDTHFIASLGVNNIDELQQSPFASPNEQNAQAALALVKAMPTGGVIASSISSNYRYLPNAASQQVPAQLYEQRLTIGIEQPLLRNFGVELNQILTAFPVFGGTGANAAAQVDYNNRSQAANNLGLANEGILISRIRIDQQRAEFERRVQNLLLNVEVAYWKLYESYGILYSYEEVLRIAHKAWVQNHAKFLAGTIGPANYHPIRAQYEEFRGNRIESLAGVLERERILRGLLGLQVEDGKRIVPIDPPTLAPFQPEWDSAVQMAIYQKPELSLVRDNLRTAQYQIVQQQNFLKPDLKFTAQYSPIGFGPRLDGDGTFTAADGSNQPSNADRSLASSHFNEWSLGLTFAMPLGYRLEHAALRAARLQLAQSYYLLKDLYYQAVTTQYTKIEANRAERVAYGLAVEARYREFAVGKATVSDFLLDAMRRLVAAQLKEYNAIEEYNSDLARYEWAKGNAMKHNNVLIADGNIPVCAEVRAVDHERERARAIVLRERPKNDAIRTPGLLATTGPSDPDDPTGGPGVLGAALPPAPTMVNPVPQYENRPTAPVLPVPQTLPSTPATPISMGPSTRTPNGLGNGVTVIGSPNATPAFRPISSTQATPTTSALPVSSMPSTSSVNAMYSSPYAATPIPTTTTSPYAPTQPAPLATPVAAPTSVPQMSFSPYVPTPSPASIPSSAPSGNSSVYVPSTGSTLR